MSESKSLALMPLSDVRQLAELAAKSGMFPAIKSPEAAMALMMVCQAEGLHPWHALRRYHIVDGKPSMRADAMLADFQDRGGKVEWVTRTHEICEAVFHAPNMVKPEVVRWTIQDAQRAGLAGKANWQKHPRQMLAARVISEGVRLTMASVVAGLYTPEEVQDFDSKPDYTPPAAAPPSVAPSAPDVAPPPHPGVEAAKAAFPGATVVDDSAAAIRLKRLGKLFTMPAPDGLGWRRPAIVQFLAEAFHANQLGQLTPAQVEECETKIIELMSSKTAAA